MLKFPIRCIFLFKIPNGTQFLNSKLQMRCVMNCKKINKCIGNQQCNRHLYFPGQHHSSQELFSRLFHTYDHFQGLSRPWKFLHSIPYFSRICTNPVQQVMSLEHCWAQHLDCSAGHMLVHTFDIIVRLSPYLYLLPFPSGWTTSSAEAVHQLRPNAQPRHNQRLGKSISSSYELERLSPYIR